MLSLRQFNTILTCFRDMFLKHDGNNVLYILLLLAGADVNATDNKEKPHVIM